MEKRVVRLAGSLLAMGLGVLLSASSACSSPVALGGFDEANDAAPARTLPSGGDADPDASTLLQSFCIATECPAPFATCGRGHKCTTNLSDDVANCGECGNECPYFPSLNVQPRCSGGKCRYDCADSEHLDCNGIVEDGCEINRMWDPGNCGACGHSCPDGVRCILGNCGCPPGTTECGDSCVDLKRDDRNCSACGIVCPQWREAGWDAPPPNMIYKCFDGVCRHLECVAGYKDCDGKIENGCEIHVARDPENCADCGVQCGAEQICAVAWGELTPRCLCNVGQTLCGDRSGDVFTCADLLSDVDNCGACNNECMTLENAVPNVIAGCKQGRCVPSCAPGFADCDGDASNGCEVNLKVDGSNCGACGRWCNAAAGQPCMDGACLMMECDAGGPPR